MTRQWNIDPKLLCRQHLLGEHNEIHKSLGFIRAGRSADGWLRKGQIDPITYVARHAQLTFEMMRRGYNHQSPLDVSDIVLPIGNIDVEYNMRDLQDRCENCFEGIMP
jgi:hypothetical protein